MRGKTAHQCPAPGCLTRIPRTALMCTVHLALVPPETMQRVKKATAQRHRGGTYEQEFYNARKRAIDDVRRQLEERVP